MAKDESKWMVWRLLQCKVSTAGMTSLLDLLLDSNVECFVISLVLLVLVNLVYRGGSKITPGPNMLIAIIAITTMLFVWRSEGTSLRPVVCFIKVDLKLEKLILLIVPVLSTYCPKPLRKKIKRIHKFSHDPSLLND
ncbi:hypothetical protein QR680_016131 [Steinernema hermaphroditum]|uniref:Transmembrane protein n=1 Tax=Steinernema hermaphroditum TaxID=289476 RepID=A0AA39HC27_9BILA|nr:hypothetical protein QR680_016131 [Steinernema hermaphroditum]